MRKTGKYSPKNRQSDNTLIYILLFVFFVVLVGGLVWHYWPSEEKKWNFDNFDYEKELGKRLDSPTAKEVSKLISGNRSRIKTARRVLEGKIEGVKLSKKEKEDLKAELDKVNDSLDEILKGVELEKESPEALAFYYSELYEQAKIAARLKVMSSFHRPSEQSIKQMKVQEEWEKSVTEEETKEIMNGWIKKWYQQAKDEIIRPGREKLLTEPVWPLKINGEKVDNPSQDQFELFKKKYLDKEGKAVDFSLPLNLRFDGYWGFLTEEDKKDSTEGTEVFGLTKSGADGTMTTVDDSEFEYIYECDRPISIGLEKKLFFNRLGYEQWITPNDKGGTNYFDISFEDVVETIAHELAHAIINTIRIRYKGEEGGGHGKWFYDTLEEIEEMIKNSPDFPEFETWWKEAKKAHPKWAANNVLVDEKKGHWDEWKYWYIGGGVGILAIGLAVVIVFWDSPSNSKRSVKN